MIIEFYQNLGKNSFENKNISIRRRRSIIKSWNFLNFKIETCSSSCSKEAFSFNNTDHHKSEHNVEQEHHLNVHNNEGKTIKVSRKIYNIIIISEKLWRKSFILKRQKKMKESMIFHHITLLIRSNCCWSRIAHGCLHTQKCGAIKINEIQQCYSTLLSIKRLTATHY